MPGAKRSSAKASRCRPSLAWSRIAVGQLTEAIDQLNEARGIAERPQLSDVDRADVLFRLGVARYKLSSIATATAG